jgi:hypothetical protein
MKWLKRSGMESIKFRHIFTLAMIGLMLLSGLPLFVPEDANHDRSIDIKDAVIKLQIADHHATAQSIAACEETLKAAAGIKEIVPPEFETDKSYSANFCFLIPSHDTNPMLLAYDIISENSVSFSSISFTPPHQPPIFS